MNCNPMDHKRSGEIHKDKLEILSIYITEITGYKNPIVGRKRGKRSQ